MTTELLAYRNTLLLALRLRDVPGPRIAEAWSFWGRVCSS